MIKTKKPNYNILCQLPQLVTVAIIILLSSCFTLFSCKNEKKKIELKSNLDYSLDLPAILKKGKLTVLAENSSTSYFIYKGEKAGFEYEILKDFANELGVELEIKVIYNLDLLNEMLENGEGDIIAANLTVSKERKKVIDFSVPILYTNQVLVQREASPINEDNTEEKAAEFITDPSQLAEKKITVWKNSSYAKRLHSLSEEIGDTIYIQEKNGQIGSEELIEMVSEGLIDYTVVDRNIADINEKFYENLNVSVDISYLQKVAFGLRKSCPLLTARLNDWLKNFTLEPKYNYIKHKYFDLAQTSMKYQVEMPKLKGGQISIYDDIFKEAAAKYSWDWQLPASIAYQESKFNPDVIGFGGSYGMMQFMPAVGPKFGVYPDSPPREQIMGGMKKIVKDFDSWSSIKDETQRLKFALASYNAGKGHILDAQSLARKHKLDPQKWDDNVEVMLLNLSKQEYYRDEVVKYGSMRGTTTHHYVRSVFARYQQWLIEHP